MAKPVKSTKREHHLFLRSALSESSAKSAVAANANLEGDVAEYVRRHPEPLCAKTWKVNFRGDDNE